MKRPEPIQKEITFGLNEMFFSTTDHRGVILDGNDVFVRISKYTRDELIGAPHNIIRHPDMPKVVFKALWDTILSGKTICAYVKNLAKDGSFYWVFATVIPIGEDFLSIRMKPTTHLKDVVEGLYKELLRVEKSSGVEASLKVLISTLNSLGFPDYESFVLAAISAELSNRHDLQGKEFDSLTLNNKSSLINTAQLTTTRESLFKMFTIINKLSTHAKSIAEKMNAIKDISRDIEFSALNATIEAEKLGEQGKALSAVALHISSSAAEAKNLNSDISLLAAKMLGNLGEFRSMQLSIALSTLQIEMLSCFAQEWNDHLALMDENEFKKNVSMLIGLIDKSLKHAWPIIDSLCANIKEISSKLEQTFQVLMTLTFIQKTGSIESARLSNAASFSHLFSVIMNLLNDAKISYKEFSELINDVIKKDVVSVTKEYKDAEGFIRKNIAY